VSRVCNWPPVDTYRLLVGLFAAKFDALLDVIGEVTFWHLNDDALDSEITERDDEVDGEAVRALNPA